jgi:hypothetical protein
MVVVVADGKAEATLRNAQENFAADISRRPG